MPILEIHSTHVAYDESAPTSHPSRVYVDWTRNTSGVEVSNPDSKAFRVLPGESKTLFSGIRDTEVANDTEFDLELNTAKSGTYRMLFADGTEPEFRTDRGFAGSGIAFTLTVNNNATLEVAIASGDFNASVGDSVFIPGASTGDAASSFSELNVGFWVVIAESARLLVLQRPVGEDFVGVSESVTPGADEFYVFSATGVQVGDSMEVSAGFSSVTRQTFEVTSVTPLWVEFVSTQPLPLESDVTPTATGLVFYSDCKRYLRLECDQEAAVRLNGDTGNSNRLSPRVPGDAKQVAHFEKWGPVWEMVVVNRSATATMNVNLLTVE
jgi:hypothetical protein